MPSSGAITILHVSDMQFGRNHRFGRLALPPDDRFDSLLERLQADLRCLREEENLQPDILAVTGDLAEGGKKSEFDDALEFIERFTSFLTLNRNRVIIIAGNHDINRSACEAYFNECEADDQQASPPYWPKWKHFYALFKKFYMDEPAIAFTREQPWTLFEIPDLKVVVAGLNSTIAEGHRDGTHFGYVGETQLRSFVERLKPFKENGWLRIGAVHHNYQRGSTDDEENLRDADDLKNILGTSLNLLLHGHTHEGKVAWLNQNVPVVSTGSAALTTAARPEDVPNQYQMIRIHADKIERWTRCFDPRQKRWIGDNRSSATGNKWITVEKVQFEHVSEICPADGKSSGVDCSESLEDENEFHMLTCGIKGIQPARTPAQPSKPSTARIVLRGMLEQIRELRSEQLIDDVVAQEYQRRLLNEILEL
jgi:3',5'-cyclic AMP phosphodiesterase CpdA